MLYLNSRYNLIYIICYNLFNRKNRQNDFNTNVKLFKEETFKWCSLFIVEFAVTFDDLIDNSDIYHSDNYEHHMNIHRTLEELKIISPDHVIA